MKIEKALLSTSKGKLQYFLQGEGLPPIVLVNGGSGPIEGWMRILPELTGLSTVFAYNRFGVGASDKPKEAQDGRTIVEALREALKAAGLEPPYVLAGHSLGGLYVNLFARLYPEETVGVVLIEASHPDDLQLNDYQSPFVRWINKLLAKLDSFSAHQAYAETKFVERTVEQLREAGPFPEVPLVVVTGGRENNRMPEEARRLRRNHQLELLTLSQNSTHLIAQRSGHFPQLTEPDIVLQALRNCLEKARAPKA